MAKDAYRLLEFQVSIYFMQKHIPAGATILDAGGGPGRYTLEFCRLGHPVTLLDLTPGHIAFAREQLQKEPAAVQARLVDSMVGDICDLSRFDDGQFDATICLGGPISHIPTPPDRQRAVAELVRVTKPGGAVCIGVIGYLAVLRTIMMESSHELIDGSLDNFFTNGNSPGPGKMLWHWFRAQELRELAESHELTTLAMVGCQSLSSGLEETTNRLCQEEEKWQKWFDILLAMASDPAVVDLAEHILYIGRVEGY